MCVASGAFPILGGLGLIPIRLANDTPGWVAVAAGSTFLLAAGVLVVDAIAGGIGPDGELPPGAGVGLHAAQSVFGFGIVVAVVCANAIRRFAAGRQRL